MSWTNRTGSAASCTSCSTRRQHDAQLNTSVISDNQTLATAIDELNAVNQSLVAANGEFTP